MQLSPTIILGLKVSFNSTVFKLFGYESYTKCRKFAKYFWWIRPQLGCKKYIFETFSCMYILPTTTLHACAENSINMENEMFLFNWGNAVLGTTFVHPKSPKIRSLQLRFDNGNNLIINYKMSKSKIFFFYNLLWHSPFWTRVRKLFAIIC